MRSFTKKIILFILLGIFLNTSSYSQNVYITKTGKKYHSTSCRYLKFSKIEVKLSNAVEQGYAACKVCKPVGIKTNKKTSTISKSKYTSKRCQATTKKGTQCKRKSKAGSSYCWQHR